MWTKSLTLVFHIHTKFLKIFNTLGPGANLCASATPRQDFLWSLFLLKNP